MSSHSRALSCVSWAERRAATRAWARALAFSLIAWGALLGAVFGGTTATLTHTMAAKLAGSSLHLQRQAGASSATRSARRDQAQLSETPRLVAALYSAALDDTGDDPLAQGVALRSDNAGTQTLNNTAAAPQLKPRYSAPPARAPPALA